MIFAFLMFKIGFVALSSGKKTEGNAECGSPFSSEEP